MNYVTGYKLETAILGIYEVSTQAVNWNLRNTR
jgi:hypothetical protein